MPQCKPGEKYLNCVPSNLIGERMGVSRVLVVTVVAILLVAVGFLLVLEQRSLTAMVIGIPESALHPVECPGESIELVLFDFPKTVALGGAEHGLALLSLDTGDSPSARLHINGGSTESFGIGQSVLLEYDTLLIFKGLGEGDLSAVFCVVPGN